MTRVFVGLIVTLSLAQTAICHGDLSSETVLPMQMTFTSTTKTALYSAGWAPASAEAYAGICIFLIVLAATHRSLVAMKRTMERRWMDLAWNRRHADAMGNQSESENAGSDLDLKAAALTAGHKPVSGVQPWRFNVDLPRAAMEMAITGVGFLLMLAVMTMNVGYFFSVLGGTFLGELAVGRYS